jgi:hypothetical protein
MEQKRGISITSTVLQFPYHDAVLNLLDTPGHRDFSEDTYRVLAAADAAIMVLDGAKGIEPQTLKLFEVCRDRNLPLLTFINKWDRPGRDPLELLDQVESLLSIQPTPVTWPVGIAGDFRGVVDRRAGSCASAHRPRRPRPPKWSTRSLPRGGRRLGPRRRRCSTSWGCGRPDLLAGEQSPAPWAGLTNFGGSAARRPVDLAPRRAPVRRRRCGPASSTILLGPPQGEPT